MYRVIRRYELSDAEWQTLQGFLPSVVTGGRPRSDDRRVLNGIVWKIRASATPSPNALTSDRRAFAPGFPSLARTQQPARSQHTISTRRPPSYRS